MLILRIKRGCDTTVSVDGGDQLPPAHRYVHCACTVLRYWYCVSQVRDKQRDSASSHCSLRGSRSQRGPTHATQGSQPARPVPRHMVSSAKSDTGPLGEAQLTSTARILANPLYATSALLRGNQFPLPTWRPRSGRNIQYLQWHSELKKLFAALDVTEDFIYSSPPSSPLQVHTALPCRRATRSKKCSWGPR